MMIKQVLSESLYFHTNTIDVTIHLFSSLLYSVGEPAILSENTRIFKRVKETSKEILTSLINSVKASSKTKQQDIEARLF